MSQKQQSTNTASYNPAGMSAYNSLMPQFQSLLTQYMQNPAQSGMFQQRLQQSLKGVHQLGQQGASNIMRNVAAGGFGGGNLNAFHQAMLAQNSRATSANASNAFTQNLLGQSQLQQRAMGMAAGFKPLQTGSTSTQTVSGLGTWLPQLVAGGLGLASGIGTGGATTAMGGGAGGLGAWGGANFGAPPGYSPLPSSNFFAGIGG